MVAVGFIVMVPYCERCKNKPGVKPTRAKSIFYSICACFAAGMLLSIACVHIMPEATALYNEYLEHAGETEEEHALHIEEDITQHIHYIPHPDEVVPVTPVDPHAGHNHRILEEEDAGHDDHSEEEGAHGFPLPEALVGLGFIIMLSLDQVIFKKSAVLMEKIETCDKNQVNIATVTKVANDNEGGNETPQKDIEM